MIASISHTIALLAALVGLGFLGEIVLHLFTWDLFQMVNAYLVALTCLAIICMAIQGKKSSIRPR